MRATDRIVRVWASAAGLVSLTVAAALVGVLVGIMSRPSQPGHVPQGVDGFDYRDRYSFETLGEMVATADLVVEGTVRSAARGDSIYVDGVAGARVETPLYFTILTITVDVAHWGEGADVIEVKALTLTKQPPFVRPPSFPFPPDSAFLVEGARVLLFLDRPGDGTYRLLNRQGAFLVDASGVGTSDPESGLTAGIAAKGASELHAALSAAISEAQEGLAQPVAPGP
jgi:hypothetical protein